MFENARSRVSNESDTGKHRRRGGGPYGDALGSVRMQNGEQIVPFVKIPLMEVFEAIFEAS